MITLPPSPPWYLLSGLEGLGREYLFPGCPPFLASELAHLGCGTMSYPVSPLDCPCLPAVAIYGTVNRGSEFTHMRVGPVGYHNKMRQLESTYDRRLMAVLTSTPHCFT